MKNNSHQTINKLQKQVNYLKSLLDQSPDIIVAGDVKGNIVEFNKGAEKLLGYKKEEVLGKPIASLYFRPRERSKIIQLVKRKGSIVDYETRLKTKSGQMLSVSTTLSYLRDENGNIIGTIGMAKDIQRRKLLEAELKKMAITDGLTGLYDRGYFNRRVDIAVKKAHRYKRPLALIMMDLDGFKKYNDTYGHLEGDKILHKVGRIILRTIRSRIDSCYRFGGDEFMIIVPEEYEASARDLAEELRTEVDLAFGPRITASIGVTKLQRGQSVYELIKLTDQSMYRAKARGGNCVYPG